MKSENVLRNSITGCKTFAETSNAVYRGEIDIQFGHIIDVFTLEIRRVKEKMPSYYHLYVKGKGKLGEIQGTADLLLNESNGATKLSINADIQVTGTLAIFANQIVDGEANRMIANFMKRLEKEVKRGIYQERKGRR